MASGRMVLSASELEFSKICLQYSSTFWQKITKYPHDKNICAMFLVGYNDSVSSACSANLASHFANVGDECFIVKSSDYNKSMGFLCFENIIDKIKKQTGWFSENCTNIHASMLLPLINEGNCNNFDTLIEKNWDALSPFACAGNAANIADIITNIILETNSTTNKRHIIFENVDFKDAYFFNTMLLLFKKQIKMKSSGQVILWILSPNTQGNDKSLQSLDFMQALCAHESPRVYKQYIEAPHPYEVRALIDVFANPVQRQKSDKIALDVLAEVQGEYLKKALDFEWFVPSLWLSAIEKHLHIERKINDEIALPPKTIDNISLDKLFAFGCFEAVLQSIGLQKLDNLPLFEQYCLACSLWFFPEPRFEAWVENFFKDDYNLNNSTYIYSLSMRLATLYHKFDLLLAKKELVFSSFTNKELHAIEPVIITFSMLSRMSGSQVLAQDASMALQKWKNLTGLPCNKYLEITLQAVLLGFSSAAEIENSVYWEQICNVCNQDLFFAQREPLLFTLFVHAVITLLNTLGMAGAYIDTIGLLQTELKIRSRIFPIQERCLHIGNVSMELSEYGRFSEAISANGEALTIARFGYNSVFLAYALHDLVGIHFHGGIIINNWLQYLQQAEEILAVQGNTLELWRTKVLKIFCGYFASKNKNAIKKQIVELTQWNIDNNIEVPVELQQEYPVDMLFADNIPISKSIMQSNFSPETLLALCLSNKGNNAAELELLIAWVLSELKRRKPSRQIHWANVFATVANESFVSAKFVGVLANISIEMFLQVFLVGWVSLDEKQQLLESACISKVLSLSCYPWQRDSTKLLRLITAGLGSVVNAQTLQLIVAVGLAFLLPEVEVQLSILATLLEDNSNEQGFMNIKITKPNAREAGLHDELPCVWNISTDIIIAESLIISDIKGGCGWSEERIKHKGGSRLTHDSILIPVHNSIFLLAAKETIVFKFTFVNEFDILPCLHLLTNSSEVFSLVTSLRFAIDAVRNYAKNARLEKDFYNIANKQVLFATELSRLLEKEREKLSITLLEKHKALEATTHHLEAALSITRDLFTSFDGMQVLAKAAGHILRFLNFAEPCVVEIYVPDSFFENKGNLYCIHGLENITKISENITNLYTQNLFESTPNVVMPPSLALSYNLGLVSIPISHNNSILAVLNISTINNFSGEEKGFIDIVSQSLAVVLLNINFLEKEKKSLLEIISQFSALHQQITLPFEKINAAIRLLNGGDVPLASDMLTKIHAEIGESLNKIRGIKSILGHKGVRLITP